MPAKSARQYGLMQGVMHGTIKGLGVPRSVAKEFVEKTPASKRKAFASALQSKKKKKK